MKFTNLVRMIADQNFYDICFTFFYPTASATVYGRRPKFFRAKHSATAEGENCAYGPTLCNTKEKPSLEVSFLHCLYAKSNPFKPTHLLVT